MVLVPLLFLDATLLRMDHIRMTELRDAVLAADASENDEEVTKRLEELREYTLSNIVVNVVDDNGAQKIKFGTGPFYLEHQYIKAANLALEEAENQLTGDNNPNGNVYAAAASVCRAEAISNGWEWDNPNYINCMVSEIQKYPAADEIQDTIRASLPSTELYRCEFVSPMWAPTVSGFMLLLTFIVIVVIIIRILIWIVLRLSLLFI